MSGRSKINCMVCVATPEDSEFAGKEMEARRNKKTVFSSSHL